MTDTHATTDTRHHSVRRADLAECFSGDPEDICGTGRGPWPVAKSCLWSWHDGQDTWYLGEPELESALSAIEGEDEEWYQELCDAMTPLYSRIGVGKFRDAETFVAHVLERFGAEAAEEVADSEL